MKKNIMIYIDHGEAYGNMGDEAMLLCAMIRLNKEIDKCDFIVPIEFGQPLPELLPNTQYVVSPRQFFKFIGRIAKIITVIKKYLCLCLKIIPEGKSINETDRWEIALRMVKYVTPLLFVFFPRTAKSICKLKDCDLLYTVGAATLNDFNLRDIAYRYWLYALYNKTTGLCAMSSQAIGPLNSQWGQIKMHKVLSYSDFITFRDFGKSKAIVESLGLGNAKYVGDSIVGDEAFTLEVPNDDRVNSYLEGIGLKEEDSFIAVHFRPTDYTTKKKCNAAQLAKILDAMCEVTSHKMVFFPMSYHAHSGSDWEYGSAIKKYMSKSDRLLLAPLCKDFSLVKGGIGRALYSFGLSYHVHVFALSQNKPAIILFTGDYYRFKSEGLINFYGKPCDAIDIDNVTTREIGEALLNIENNYRSTVKDIIKVNKEILKKNDCHIKAIKHKMERYIT